MISRKRGYGRVDVLGAYELGSKRVRPDSERSYRGYSAKLGGNVYFDMTPEPAVKGPPIEDIKRLIEPNEWPPKRLLPAGKRT